MICRRRSLISHLLHLCVDLILSVDWLGEVRRRHDFTFSKPSPSPRLGFPSATHVRRHQASDRFNINSLLDHLQAKYVRTGHADLNRFEWAVNIQREGPASTGGNDNQSSISSNREGPPLTLACLFGIPLFLCNYREYDPFDIGFLTTADFTNADILEAMYPAIAKRLHSDWISIFVMPLITGFLGKGWKPCAVTTLGRGGSDLTATTIVKTLGLRQIQVWKDVDGVLTCDLSIHSRAEPVPYLTFEEAAGLAYFGAQHQISAVNGSGASLGIPLEQRLVILVEAELDQDLRRVDAGVNGGILKRKYRQPHLILALTVEPLNGTTENRIQYWLRRIQRDRMNWFVVKIPDSLSPEQAAPLLCAGVTSYSPLKQFLGTSNISVRAGILGLGGVGHLGVPIAKAMGHHVTVISSSDLE